MQSTPAKFHRTGFTLMEMLVVIAIITVLAAIAYPLIARMRANANKLFALNRMKNLAAAANTYAGTHNGILPSEDVVGADGWASSISPEAEKTWYNALPRQMGEKALGDFVKEGRQADFYTKQSILFLPGASYPTNQRNVKPLFAIAINTKLHRKARKVDGQKDPAGLKSDLNISTIQLPSRTVLFLEQGLPGESRAHPTIAKGDYDGSCKGSAKSFVARYTDRGIIAFCDGHADEVSAKDILGSDGRIIWDDTMATNNQSATFWTADPKEDPN